MTHWYCPACQHVWDDNQPPSMEIDATTPDDVVEAFVMPGTCPQCSNFATDLIDDDMAAIRVHMRESAIWHLMTARGMTRADAELEADRVLNAPPAVPLPTLDEL
jgi:rubredoxin